MMRIGASPVALVFAFGAPEWLSAQIASTSTKTIPVRQLEIVARSTEPSGTQMTVRALSDGSVFVNDFNHGRVLLFDSTLKRFTSVIDSASSGVLHQSSMQLIRGLADSTLYVDLSVPALLVLGPEGKVVRVMALPRPRDARFIAATVFGDPQRDRHGGLVYQALFPLTQKPSTATPDVVTFPSQPDSAPIVRADFDRRTVDTIAFMKVPQSESMTQTQDGKVISQ